MALPGAGNAAPIVPQLLPAQGAGDKLLGLQHHQKRAGRWWASRRVATSRHAVARDLCACSPSPERSRSRWPCSPSPPCTMASAISCSWRPALAVLGGLGGAGSGKRCGGGGVGQRLDLPPRCSRPVLSLLVKEMVQAASLSVHPFQRHRRGRWGQRQSLHARLLGPLLKQAAQELGAARCGAQPTGGAGASPSRPLRPAQVELGPEFLTTGDTRGADGAFTMGEFYCAELAAPVMVEIAREGVVYARVGGLRGRTSRA